MVLFTYDLQIGKDAQNWAPAFPYLSRFLLISLVPRMELKDNVTLYKKAWSMLNQYFPKSEITASSI